MGRAKSVQKHGGKARGRRVNLMAVYLLVGVLLALVFAVLSLTVFFNLSTFDISGDVPYTQEQIIEASGLKTGTNLLRLDEETVKNRILAQLPYVETASVTVRLPAAVHIELTQASQYAYIPDGGSYWIINSLGRVLERSSTANEDLVELTGVMPPEKTLEENTADGKRTYAVFDDDRTAEALSTLAQELSVSDIGRVTRMRADSYLDISFVIEDRVRVELGSMVDIDYKMKYVRKLFSDKSVPSEGLVILDVSNTDRVTLRTNANGSIKIEDILGQNTDS